MSNNLAGDRTRAREQLEKGKQLYHDDKDEEAVLAFMEAVRLDPDLAEAHFRLGLGYESLGKREEAEAQYKKAVAVYKKYFEQNENDAQAHYDFGQTYAGLGQYSDAIREYRESTKLKDDDPDVFYDLGVAHTKLAQYDQAAAAFQKRTSPLVSQRTTASVNCCRAASRRMMWSSRTRSSASLSVCKREVRRAAASH